MFNKSPCNWVELDTAEAFVQSAAYVAANCVAAGLVRTPRRWPGAKVLVDEMGRRVVTVKRPDFYFDPDNPNWPEEVSIPIVMPKMLVEAYGSEDAAREVIQLELDRLIRKAHADNKRSGRGYAGRKRVLKTPHTARARMIWSPSATSAWARPNPSTRPASSPTSPPIARRSTLPSMRSWRLAVRPCTHRYSRSSNST